MKSRISLFIIFMAIGSAANTQVVKGVSLLPDTASLFTINSKANEPPALQLVDVKGQSFNKAYHITTLNQAGNDGLTFHHAVDAMVSKGDVLLLSFYTRSIQSKKETGESFMEISLDRIINGKYEWPPVFERGMSFGTGWTLTQIPFVAAADVQKGNLSLVIKCGEFPQVFELGDISLINYKQSAKLSDLPRTRVHYDGDAPDAPWRKAAAARIEKYRKANLAVNVRGSNGLPVAGAKVMVRMKKNAFAWGTATNSKLILDSLDPAAKIYRDTLLRYFNKVVLENEMKSKNWSRSNHAQSIAAVTWFKEHGISVRGHVMVWPSWQHSPHLVSFKNDTAALRSAILKDIDDETSVMKGRFAEWDVINEPFAHDVFLQLLGRNIMVDWFAAARERTPGVQLFLNDYTMFHDQKSSEKFYDNIQFLKDNKASIDAIGEQGHIGGTPPGIEHVIERLNHFSKLQLPIQISEFDITSDDDDFKASYMRDFMTAIFSHPAVIGFMQWGFWANAHWIPAAALWDKDWHIRPEGKVYTELVSRTWVTNEEGVTSKQGEYAVRAFKGDYEITVTHNGKSVQKNYKLDGTGGSLMIELAK